MPRENTEQDQNARQKHTTSLIEEFTQKLLIVSIYQGSSRSFLEQPEKQRKNVSK